jgi:hypothetical protein
MSPAVIFLRRAAALAIAFAFLTTSVTIAQTPSPTPGTTLLSQTAFARLAHAPKPIVAPRPIGAPRLNLRVEIGAPAVHQAGKGSQERSWASRHKGAMAFIIAGAAFGGILLVTFARCGGGSAPSYCE